MSIIEKRGERLIAGKPPSQLVDVEHGKISREIFVSEELFDLELENLFARAWLFVGHASQIPNPGDFFVSRMGVDSVLMTRDEKGEVHVLLNSCRHRGMKVCRYDEGNALQFTCPYHGWSYSVDGSLVSTPGELYGVPQFETAYGGKLDKSSWGLVRAPKLANYRGLIFASWDEAAPPFDEYVGDFHYWLDNLTDSLDGEEGATVVFRGVQKWRVRSNWKFVAENFLGDMYHGRTSHASVDPVGIGPGGKTGERHGYSAGREPSRRETSFVRLGHGACSNFELEKGYPTFVEPELTGYFERAWETRRKRRLETDRPTGSFSGAVTLFPSLSMHTGGFPKGILVAHPISPWQTEMWRWMIVDREAPDFVKEWLRHYYLRYAGPAGLTEQDDMENWDYATESSRAVIARRYPYNYQQGLGMTTPGPLRGSVESTAWTTEENARNFYRRWSEFVAGQTWEELMAGT